MVDPIPGVKYRIQSVDLQMYLEIIDPTNDRPPFSAVKYNNVRFRPMKEDNRQYWTFERVPLVPTYRVQDLLRLRSVANSDFYLCYNRTQGIYTSYGPDVAAAINVAHQTDGTYRLFCPVDENGISDDDYWLSNPDSTTAVKFVPRSQLCAPGPPRNPESKWQLVPVASQPNPRRIRVKDYPLETGVYRIRNLNGRSLLTCDKDDNEVYGESQLDQTNQYQRWNVTPQQASGTLHTYVIQNAGSNLYLGCRNAAPSSGDNLVGVETAFQWDLQIIEGFGASFCIPNKKLSVGLVEDEVGHEFEPSIQLIPSDITPNQMWYMENLKFTPIGKDMSDPLPEGNYLLQNCHDQTMYMTGARSPFRITTGTAATSEFELKYIDQESGLFTLTYVTNANVSPVVADGGGYITLNRKGTQFVLLKKAQGQYLICLPGYEDPHKVVSGRLIIDMDDNPVLSIEDETGEALQKWKFIHGQ